MAGSGRTAATEAAAQGDNIHRARQGKRLIQVWPMGNLGNRMLQYMAAMALQSRVQGSRIAQIDLPEWGIHIAPEPAEPDRILRVGSACLDLALLADHLSGGLIDGVDIASYAQRMENLLPAHEYRLLFHGPLGARAGADELLCNIRQGDILSGQHPDYVLVPIDFYADLVAQTGLSPVFMGQIEDSPYMRALRRRFPRARYVASQGAVADFTFIRNSKNIVPAVSTFSWLAAWLSGDTRIFMPVLGHLNPWQSGTTQLLPLGDARYRFYLFPAHYAVPMARVARAHASLRGGWRLMGHGGLRRSLRREWAPRDLPAYLAAFDEAFYLATYPDIAASVAAGHIPSGRHHYEFFGSIEGRQAFPIDSAWYCETYPLAAWELGQGDARDAADHWLTTGRERGYARCPPEAAIKPVRASRARLPPRNRSEYPRPLHA
jgi:hypothetical protein